MRFFSHNKTRENRIITLFKAIFTCLWRFYSVSAFLLLTTIVTTFSLVHQSVFAGQIDTTQYIQEKLVVIPENVSSDTWKGFESVLIFDLDDESLYSNFTKHNSAYVPVDELREEIEKERKRLEDEEKAARAAQAVQTSGSDSAQSETVETENETENESETSEVTDPENSSASANVESAEDEIPDAEEELVEAVEEVAADEPENEPEEVENEVLEAEEEVSEPEEETNEPEVDEEISFAPFKRAKESFNYVFAQVTEQFFTSQSTTTTVLETELIPLEESIEASEDSSDSAGDSEADTGVVDTEAESSDQSEEQFDDVESEVAGVSTTTEDSVVEDEVIDEAPVEIETDESATSTTDETSSGGQESASTTEESETDEADGDSPLPAATEEELFEPFVKTPCLEAEGCQTHTLLFDGFGVPTLAGAAFIENAQIRMSLAARERSQVDTEIQRLSVEYSFGSEEWTEAGSIDIDEEVSNALNGGVFLFALPRIPNTRVLEKMQVRLVYEGDPEGMQGLFVDTLWLEVSTGALFETEFSEEVTDEIVYSRDLLLPTYNELEGAQSDFKANDALHFSFEHQSQKGLIGRVWDNLFKDRTFEIDGVHLMHPVWGEIDANFDIEYRDDDSWSLKMLSSPQEIRPGKYEVHFNVIENDEVYIDTFEFYWGVLAVNTIKSMYSPHDEVMLNMAALTDKGDTICDADLRLTITDPEFNIHHVDVEQGGDCGDNNITDVPDYLASFDTTSALGEYQISLSHYNKDGEQVHHILDSFEVREYIPFDIERTAPTRIYPPAPYEVSFKITANRSFKGDIVERMPAGFVLNDDGGGVFASYPTYSTLTWHNIALEEGEEIELSYEFDAPDISPYLYMLGPLDMDGFTELRTWQIASDALGGVAALRGFQTTDGTELNGASSATMLWSTSTFDTFYFDHSTSTESNKLIIKTEGDYTFSLSMPIERTDNDNNRARWGAEIRVNGIVYETGYARSGYVRNGDSGNNHNESSNNVHVMIPNLQVDDEVEVYVDLLTTLDAGITAIISDEAKLFAEYISPSENVFAATTTQPIGTTTLNRAANEMTWTETRQDAGFLHSDAVNPENITIVNPGEYFVTINIPLNTELGDNVRRNILGRVLLDGIEVPGGQFSQGYLRGEDQTSDGDSSIHWSGVVISTTSSQVLSISVEQDADAGDVTVTPGAAGSVFIQELPSSDVIVVTGTQLVTDSDEWNPASATEIEWETRSIYDAAVFTHATNSSPENITLVTAGDYFVSFNAAFTNGDQRNNPVAKVYVNGAPYLGAEVKHAYQRDQQGHEDSSLSLTYLLEGLSSSDVISVVMEREAATGAVDDATEAQLMIWKKEELDLRPNTFTFYDTPFDNVRFASTAPAFLFSVDDPDGSSDLIYEFSIATSTDFFSSTTRSSAVHAGFSNLNTPADTSPFTETEQIGFKVQSADTLTDATTYYWRVRAKDVTGSGQWGAWTAVQSLTVDSGVETPEWFQTFDGQFDTNDLLVARSSGSDSVEVDVTPNSEILLVYGEQSDTTPNYRFWNGISWSSEQDMQSIGAEVFWSVTAAGSTRDEYIAATLDADSDINVQVYSASTSAWGNLNEIVTNAAINTNRGIAVSYETVSGDAIVVACDNDADPVYSVWNGYSWSATGTINVTTTGFCNWLTMASDPTSDEIILMHRGDVLTDAYEAFVWNGSSWGDSQLIGDVGDVRAEGMSVVYEESGDQAIAVATDGNFNGFEYSTWDGSSWTLVLRQNLHSDDYENGFLKRDEGTDRVALCAAEAGNDVSAIIWDGAAWGAATEFETSANTSVGRPVDCEFETSAGRDGYIMVPYSTSVEDESYFHDGTDWNGPNDVSDILDSYFVQTERAGDGTIISLYFDDVADDLLSTVWNGTSWSASQNLEDSPSGVNPNPRYESFSMSAKTYVLAEGTVTSNPIDFSFVPNQLTWGDLSFSGSEPSGASLRVSLYYSDLGTCDAIIPDGVLADNETGFLASSTPIDLSSLATSTYSQICLRATLGLSGSQSATLDDWTLSWQRTPKLIQHAFRWYDNLSSFTPTDPWPAGGNDLAENEVIDSENALDSGEETRLRMSLEGSNIALATGTQSFKLQYAAGNSCSAANSWFDVGAPASTTALWRGFANAIVGSDWLDENWGRRISITVDNAQVDDDVTDFPVYVDLGDLPAGFFSNIQSDGDDIRITESDGLTELSYDLVSIDTGGETGELHFKTDLSSTTDSTFYIYYENSGASAAGGSTAVWDNNFELRYALDEDPTGSVPQFKDSTSNSVDAAARSGMTADDIITGQIGEGVALDGDDGGIFESTLTFSGEYTISTWWRSTPGGDGFAFSTNAGANEKIGPWTGSGGNNMFFRTLNGGASDQTIAHPADNAWSHVVITRDSSNKVDFYVNGAAPTRVFSDAAQSGNSLWENFGGQTTQGFEGDMDELRFASVKRSDGWIITEYNNQVNPTGFYTVASEELVSDGRQILSTVLADSTLLESYEEENPTALNYNQIDVGDYAEWDFVLENNIADPGTEYCFRMVRDDGGILSSYTTYPQLITNGPPVAPTLSAPFNNEQLASTTPWFEFVTDDDVGDELAYQIQIDTDYDFSAPTLDRNSISNHLEFANVNNASDKNPFDSGSLIRFIPSTVLGEGSTYWWRVRAQDPNGSGTYGDWSIPYSVTVQSGTSITTWLQTTQEQFDTDDLQNTETNASNDVRLSSGMTNGTTTSTGVDYNDRDTGNAWGEFDFSDTLNGGTITYFIQYEVSTDNWALIPDADLSGNGAGFTSGPVNLVTLDPETYNTIRIMALFEDTGGLPEIDDWTITWGERVEQPVHVAPFDNAKVATTTPTYTFYTSDPEDDSLVYQFSISTSSAFISSSTFTSDSDTGFENTITPADTSPFTPDETISYAQQTDLTSSSTYWWRARARDPGGDNVFSEWSEAESFTIDESITVSTWHQTTGEQFETDTLTDIETASSSAQITSIVTEAMVAYGELGSLAPRFRLWDGATWGTEGTAVSISALIEWTELEASPTRDEYALGTFDNANDFNFQIYQGASSSWGNQFETGTEFDYTENSRGFDLTYEQLSGDLMVVNCVGSDADYAIWDGSSWSATSTIGLVNANDCYSIKLASDPVSDEIIMVVRHNNAAADDFELLVWDGSSWGNSLTTGVVTEQDSFGIALEYEESGDQAMAIVSNGNNANFIYHLWDGSSWSAAQTTALGNDFEWGMIAKDNGSDNLALCYNDTNNDLGFIEWNGDDWASLGGFTEVTDIAETKDGLPISCQYMTDDTNDGDVLITYTTNDGTVNEGGFYRIANGGAPGAATDLDDVEDAWHVETIRTADGLILAVIFDHNNGDRYDFTYWDGSSWAAHDSGSLISNTPSVTGSPFTASLAMAPRIFPNFITGQIVSTPIDYDDGTGPRWEELSFVQTIPGESYINYQVYYNTGTTTTLVPDAYLPNNSTGATSSPVSLALLDRTIHNELTLEADLICVDGECPTLHDWTVEWSEGITVSGTAYEYDESTVLTSGTVAVVVNGVVQAGKTGTIAGDGTWSINNVTTFEGDTVTVFIDGAVADTDEAIAVTSYDGNGDITGMNLSKRHVTIGSNDEDIVVTNAGLAGYDFSDNENLFYDIDGSNTLTVCGDSGCDDNELRVLAGAEYQPFANTITHDFENNGTTTLGTSTLRVSGSWLNEATSSVGTSEVVFTATSTFETISGSGALDFYNLTLGETTGSATWTIAQLLNVDGSMSVDYGLFARGTSSITIADDLIIEAAGLFSGLGTTTFDGVGISQWIDNTTASVNIGNVVVDGTSKTVTISSDVRAEDVYIGADDILRGGTGNTVYITGDFVNNNSFVADTSDVTFTATSTAFITATGSSFYDVSFTGVGGIWSFTDSEITATNDFAIATGTVTLPSGTTTIGGSFTNATGTFVHNNSVVVFDATTAGHTITLSGTPLYNAFYDVIFDGSGGTWAFTDVNATTTNHFIINDGTVTLPSDTLSVERDFLTNGGSFIHNDGEVLLYVQEPDSVTTNGSSFNDIRIRPSGGGTWYNDAWSYRLPITISATEVDADLTNFPVYVDMADLPSEFFDNVNSDGSDIRITESDGSTEVPREIVSIATGSTEGEMHFRATTISSSTDTTFYVYYGNSSAFDYFASDPFGAENVWSNGYVLVAHMNDLTTSSVLNSADGSENGAKASAGNPNETTTGKLYEAQEDSSEDHIAFGNLGGGATNISISAWFNSDNLNPGSGDNNTYGQTIFSAHSAGQYTWVAVGGNGGGGSPSEARFCAFDSSATCDVSSGANLQDNTWHYISAVGIDGGAATIRIDGSQVANFTSDGGGTWNSDSTIGDLRPGRNIEFDGELDEVRVANVLRTDEWSDAAYSNQATTTDFYGAGAEETTASRVFSTTNTDVLGNFIIETDGQVTLPTGILTVGGSFDNNGAFGANGGTVSFNSVTGSETIAAGNSPFATLEIVNTGGDITITENASSTVAFMLSTTTDFTLDTGITLESEGIFTNAADNASTTWTGSTVLLTSGTDFSIDTKTNDGDDYNILRVTGDGGVRMWNSTASTYDTQDTSSIYSQDHAGTDGDLYIFGNYARESGTEYWSYETDFDGADLVASSSERQANVRIANGATVLASTSVLEIVGSSTASTTIDAQAGSFTMSTNLATVTAQYFTMTGVDASGLQLLGSTTVTSFDDASFTIATADAITVDASTVDTNPASQFFRTNFINGGGGVNVDLSGTPLSYWWFREGAGDRYGESFDNGDGDPGQIRWDDSSYLISATGTVYADDGVGILGGPTCDGSTQNIRIVVDGGTYTDTTSCDGGSGEYVFNNISYQGDPTIVVYIDNAPNGDQGAVITRTPTAGIADLDLYLDRVMTRHEDTAPMTIARMALYDENDDDDLRFAAATSTLGNTLTTRPGTELYVYATTTFAPGGTVTLESGGTGDTFDGTLQLGNAATFTGAGTTTYSVGGSIIVNPNSTLTTASSTFVMTATTTGKTITASSSLTFNELEFTGVGGGWNINADIIASDDVTVSAGTVTGTGDVTLTAGALTGNGLISMGAGTVTINQSSTLGGTQPWTFNNLTLGDAATSGTTTLASTATTTVSNVLTISTGHFLDAGSSQWLLAGSGDVFVEDGTFLEDTSRVTYGGVVDANILSTTYYDLTIAGDGGTPTYTFESAALEILNDLVVAGSVPTVATLATNDPFLQVDGDVHIGANGTLIASDSTDISVFGSWDNNGAFTHNNGTTTFASPDAFTIAAGTSDFANLSVTGAGAFTVTEHATTTGVLTFATTTQPTVNPGVVLAVGGQFNHNTEGANTTWTDSILYLYSGSYELNSATTSDTYDTLAVGSGAEIRMWNSDASTTTVDSAGSLYSMDHADVAGDLYIYGAYVNTTDTDYWSYATDFDGTDLSGGSERKVDVFIENGGSVTYSGGGLEILGTSTASTTVAVQTTGDYSFDISGGTVNAEYYEFSDLDSDGLTFTGTPTITSLSNGAWTVDTNADVALTIDGTVLDQNPGKNILFNRFATSSGVSTAVNIRTTGSSVSSWRYNFHSGQIDGEAFDDDGGDPGYIVWDNSTTTYAIGGTVYQNDAASPSTACGATANIVLIVNNVELASTTCNGSGVYLFEDINFDSNDVMTVYINDETENAVAVTKEPISSISNMDLYEDHVIVRHENTNPLSIVDMTLWDSVDDADILFTATDASPDTLVLPSDTKLAVWDSKEFEPQGNITISGGGAGAAHDGTLELQDDATFTANNGEEHSIGGSLIAGSSAVFDAAQSTTTFTTVDSGRTIDTNDDDFYNLVFTGVGDWSIADTNLTVTNDFTITNGALTLPIATSTIGGSFNNSATFDASGGVLHFTAADTGNTVTFGSSEAHDVFFDGDGGVWSMNDTNATSTGNFLVATGTVTLPSGTLAVDEDFTVIDTISHNNGVLAMTAIGGIATITLSSQDLYSLTTQGGATFMISDASAALAGDLIVASGTIHVSTTTFSIAGSLDATGGVMETASGTILFNSDDVGETINPGVNEFYNVQFGNGSGGWSIVDHATATNNFTISAATSFAVLNNSTLTVENVFTNLVGGGATTWSGSILNLTSGSVYTINTKSAGGDAYDTLVIAPGTDISAWNSLAVTVLVDDTASLYSQDHATIDGDLYIFGDYHISTSTQYWSYATDFDGTVLTGGSRRSVQVRIDSETSASSTVTLEGTGTLEMIGVIGASTTIENASTSLTYSFTVMGGTLNASYYAFDHMDAEGLSLSGTPVITSLSNGSFETGTLFGNAITLSSTTLNANAAMLIVDTRFNSNLGGNNIELVGTTPSAWRLTGLLGNNTGEDYDVDGGDDCGSVRWDDSSCLLVEQTHYRWRNDDGGLGAPDSEWFNTDWDKRKRVYIENNDAVTYSTTTVEITVVYDGDMQSDFEDLRFTNSAGLVELDYWIERYTASTDAQVWVEIPELPSNDGVDLYMYYDNVLATTTSASSEAFIAADDFEDGDHTEYTGGDIYTTDGSFAYGGSFGLDATGQEGIRSNGGISRFDLASTSQGQIIRYRQYIDTTAGASDETCFLFGVQPPVSSYDNYGVCLEQFLTDRITLAEDVESTDSWGSVTELASTTVTYTTGWHEVEIDWQTDNTIDVYLYNPSGSLIATTSATDATYTSGGFGFTSWGQNGGWDSVTVRGRVDTDPTVYFGGEQVDGGATWNQSIDTEASGFEVGDVARLRVAVENSGLDITNQEFVLEYAEKGAAPSCESVNPASYSTVPPDASCGADALCMVSSTFYSDGAAIGDLLTGTVGDYTTGEAIEDPSNITSTIDIDQYEYTEIEYALSSTINASADAYCLRVTDNGSDLDSYASVAEFALQFSPSFSTLTLNGGEIITLIGGTTTSVTATGTVTDLNGYADLATATTTFYRTNVTAACTADDNNCYISSGAPQCMFSNCSGNTCDLECTADFYYHADPTDFGTFSGEEWFAFAEVEDSSGLSDFTTAPGIELMTIRALEVDNQIDYGSLEVYQDTAGDNASTTIENIGNEAIDVQIIGDDLSDGDTSTIGAENQIFATSTFTYSSCTDCTSLATTGISYELDLSKPTAIISPVEDEIYWGIYVPFGTKSNPHSGVNIFYATMD